MPLTELHAPQFLICPDIEFSVFALETFRRIRGVFQVSKYHQVLPSAVAYVSCQGQRFMHLSPLTLVWTIQTTHGRRNPGESRITQLP